MAAIKQILIIYGNGYKTGQAAEPETKKEDPLAKILNATAEAEKIKYAEFQEQSEEDIQDATYAEPDSDEEKEKNSQPSLLSKLFKSSKNKTKNKEISISKDDTQASEENNFSSDSLGPDVREVLLQLIEGLVLPPAPGSYFLIYQCRLLQLHQIECG